MIPYERIELEDNTIGYFYTPQVLFEYQLEMELNRMKGDRSRQKPVYPLIERKEYAIPTAE